MLFRKHAVARTVLVARDRDRGHAVRVPAASAQAQQPAPGSAAPPAAVGQDNASASLGTSENPPLSGLDEASLEPGVSARNFLQPGIQGSQAVDSNIGNDFGKSAVHGVTRLLGSLLLKRLWSRYETDLAYVGGGALYTGYSRTGSAIQAMDAQQRMAWRTGQLIVRDVFSYLPEGQFGAAGVWGLNSIGRQSLGSGIPGIFNSEQLGSLGQEPRITNLVLGDLVQGFTPRSAMTVTAGYGLLHFTDNSANSTQTTPSFIDSNTVNAQVAYNYQLGRRDQVALLYALQYFTFPDLPSNLIEESGSSIRTNIISILYGHRISGRMNFSIGAGPQFTHIESPSLGPVLGSSNRLTLMGIFSCNIDLLAPRCHWPTTATTPMGQGFFWAQKVTSRVSLASRPLGRRWEGTLTSGYTRNKSLISATTIAGGHCEPIRSPVCRAGVRRHLGRY